MRVWFENYPRAILALATSFLFAPTATAAWQAKDDWPINGGGYCRMISPVSASKTGDVVMVVQMALDVQGLFFVFENFPNASAKEPALFWVDDEPRYSATSRWNIDSLVVPFRVSNFVNEWRTFEFMFTTGSTFHLDFDGDRKSDVAIPLKGAGDAHRQWTECINRRK